MSLFAQLFGRMGRWAQNVVVLGVVAFLLLATSIGRLGGEDGDDGRLVAADGGVSERQLEYAKYTRPSSLDCGPGKGTLKKPTRCKVELLMGESAKVSYPWVSLFWPQTKDQKNWTSDVACVHEPQLNSKGDVEACKQTRPWKDFGVEVTTAGVFATSTTLELSKPKKPVEKKDDKKKDDKKKKEDDKKKKEDKDPVLAFSKVTTLYGLTMTAAKTGVLVLEITLYPEPIPKYNLSPYHFDDQTLNPGRYKVDVDLYRGDILEVKCFNRSLIDPSNALETGGDFCPDQMTPTELCKNQRPWASEDFTAEKDGKTKVTTISSTRKYHTKGNIVNAFLQCVTHGRDILFQLKLQPIISPRFFHFYQMPDLFQNPCHPGDGPSASQPCGGDVAPLKASYVNCTTFLKFDPPDITSPNGSFCTKPYSDVSSPCSSRKKWSDSLAKPMVQSQEQLFSVFNGGGEHLREPLTFYGRCVHQNGSALFFKYTFMSQNTKAPTAPAPGGPAPTSGAATMMMRSACLYSATAMGLLHLLATGWL